MQRVDERTRHLAILWVVMVIVSVFVLLVAPSTRSLVVVLAGWLAAAAVCWMSWGQL